MNEVMSYEQLQKLVKNPFYNLNAKELALLEEYRRQRYQPPKKHTTSFNKHSYTPPKDIPKLEEESNE